MNLPEPCEIRFEGETYRFDVNRRVFQRHRDGSFHLTEEAPPGAISALQDRLYFLQNGSPKGGEIGEPKLRRGWPIPTGRVLQVAMGLAALMLIFPPWRAYVIKWNGVVNNTEMVGYRFIGNPHFGWRLEGGPWSEYQHQPENMAIDWERLGLQLVALGLIGGLAYLIARTREQKPEG